MALEIELKANDFEYFEEKLEGKIDCQFDSWRDNRCMAYRDTYKVIILSYCGESTRYMFDSEEETNVVWNEICKREWKHVDLKNF